MAICTYHSVLLKVSLGSVESITPFFGNTADIAFLSKQSVASEVSECELREQEGRKVGRRKRILRLSCNCTVGLGSR